MTRTGVFSLTYFPYANMDSEGFMTDTAAIQMFHF